MNITRKVISFVVVSFPATRNESSMLRISASLSGSSSMVAATMSDIMSPPGRSRRARIFSSK
jgi:hypothetical protein